MSANPMEAKLVSGILDALTKCAYEIDVSTVNVHIETPKDTRFGDYSTSLAMQLTKVLKKNPREIAQNVISHFDLPAYGVEKIEIAGPGFMNFFVSNESLTGIVKQILEQKDQFGKNEIGKGIRYNVEFVSANPTGDLHIGHARQASLGDSICRLLSTCGYDVTREYYMNDAGNQIQNLALSIQVRYLQQFGKEVDLPENGYHGPDIIDIAKLIKDEVGDRYLNDDSPEALEFFRQYGLKKEQEKLQRDLEFFRVNFNVWSSEQKIRDDHQIEKVIEELRSRGFLYELDGATWFRSTDFGDDKDRVMIKSDGSYTYLTPDIAYHLNKFNRGFDYLVDLLGADHHGYINRIRAAMQALGYQADQLEIDIVQMVRAIKDGEEFKMSKRSGKALTLRDLCEEAGIDAIRYFFVARSGSSHLDFDIDLATSQSNDNPVYYAQYAHARMCSIHEQAKRANIEVASSVLDGMLVNEKEVNLLKYLNDYVATVIDAAKTRSPYKITNYINKLAQLFHTFYGECKVVDEANIELSSNRLALVEATRIVLKNALHLIGVEAPNKM